MKYCLLLLSLCSCVSVSQTKVTTPYTTTDQFDENETLAWGSKDLRIMVIGHAYDFTYEYPGHDVHADEQRLLDFISGVDPDIVVFGGDSIVGTQTHSREDIEKQWDAFNQFKSQIKARVLMVAGNHDGWSQFSDMKQFMYERFKKENKVNYGIRSSVYNRIVSLYFIYDGDLSLPVARFKPISSQFKEEDENMVFGGQRVNGDHVLETLNSSPTHFKYFSGDSELDNTPIHLENVDAYNVTTKCDKPELDAILINVGENSTDIKNLGGC
jgi:predicted MPP superfamily phosphohydrolase